MNVSTNAALFIVVMIDAVLTCMSHIVVHTVDVYSRLPY